MLKYPVTDPQAGLIDYRDAFARQPGIDPDIVHRIRRRRVKRVLTGLSPWQFRDAWTSGLLRSILRRDLLAALIAGLAYWPKWGVRQIRRALSR